MEIFKEAIYGVVFDDRKQEGNIERREEIVRCRDCRWAKPDQSDHDYRGEYRCNMWITDVSADGYCWRGKRKEGGE